MYQAARYGPGPGVMYGGQQPQPYPHPPAFYGAGPRDAAIPPGAAPDYNPLVSRWRDLYNVEVGSHFLASVV
jgi:hypothetical protein